MQSAPIAITGATGHIGGLVARLLADKGVPLRLIARDPRRLPSLPHADRALVASYGDTQGMHEALAGIHTVFLVSAREAPDRVQQHMAAIDAAVGAGVERIVYLSVINAAPDATFTFARDHFHTEQHIRSTGVAYTFLRDALYLDYAPMLVGSDGVIRGPAGDGRMAAVARDDVATVAAAVLMDEAHGGSTYDVTGREALTLTECAAQLSNVTGRTIRFENETEAEAWQSRSQYGAPEWEVEGWVTTYLAIARGEMGPASDTVFRLTGKPAQTLAEFLQSHPESYRHLVATNK
jgi:NAD(P)H dehydrogenase (quinone)